MNRRFASGLFMLALASALAAGCAWNEPVVFDQHPTIQKVRQAMPAPHPYTLAVAPVHFTQNLEREDQDGHFNPAIPPEEVTERFVEGIRKLGLFQNVLVVGERGGDLDSLLAEAWEAKADLLLDLDITRYEYYWIGTNGLFIPNIIWWSFAWAISGYVDDETFGGGIDVNASLYSVHSNRKIKTWTLREDIEMDLNDFERGWMLLGWLRVPGALDEENWRKIGEILAPRTELEVQAALGETFSEDFKAVAGTPDFARKMSKRLTLVIGIDKWDDYRLNWVRFTAGDAEALEKALTDPETGIAIPEKNMKVLINEQASLDGIQDAVENFLAERATSQDLVLIYYAGYGAASRDGKKGYLLAFDSKIDQLDKTALPLHEFKAMLESIDAKNVAVVLDTAFNGDESVRSATKTALQGASVSLDESVLYSLGAEGRIVLTASGLGQGAQAFKINKHGMFTYHLLSGLDPNARPADEDKDSAITLMELFHYAKKKVSEDTMMEEEIQTPRTFGTPRGKIALVGELEPATPPPAEEAGPEREPGEGGTAEEAPAEESIPDDAPADKAPAEDLPAEETPADEPLPPEDDTEPGGASD